MVHIVEEIMDRILPIALGLLLASVIVIRIIYCCIVHFDEMFSIKPVKGSK